MLLILLLVMGGLSLWPGGLGAGAVAPPASAPQIAGPEISWPYYRVPERLTLCGEPVPLQEPAVREDLDREFTIVVWSRAQTTMWLKRAHRYFGEVEKKLRAQRLPQDLKYVVLVESDLRPRARSGAGALGPWQFMGPTAQRYQLKCNDAMDERLDFSAATDAALRYLRDLYQLLRNWPLAMAAYNCGEGRVQKEMAQQGVQNYYRLSLPEETERYVYRVLAAKIVVEHPERYGFQIPPEELYPPLAYDEVELVVAKELPVRRLAEACGSYYKAIKTLNPWIKCPNLPPGSYRVRIPKGTAPKFHEAYRQGLIG